MSVVKLIAYTTLLGATMLVAGCIMSSIKSEIQKETTA